MTEAAEIHATSASVDPVPPDDLYQGLGVDEAPTGMAFVTKAIDDGFRETFLAVPQFSQVLKLLPPGALIAGGYLLALETGVTPKDMDVFFFGEDQSICFDSSHPVRVLSEALLAAGYKEAPNPAFGCREFLPPALLSSAGYEPNSCPVPVQLVLFNVYSSAERVLDHFDFTVCQLGVDAQNFYAGETTMDDIDAGRLVVHRLQDTRRAWTRLLRYARKGYAPTVETLEKFAPKF